MATTITYWEQLEIWRDTFMLIDIGRISGG